MQDRTHDDRTHRVLDVIDEFGREPPAMRADGTLDPADVIDVLADLIILRGPPAYVRSDNGPAFVAHAVCAWIEAVGARTAYIEPGSPWENGTVENFNARLRDELPDGEVFHSFAEAKIATEDCRRDFDAVRPHSASRWRQPAPESIAPVPTRPVRHRPSMWTRQ